MFANTTWIPVKDGDPRAYALMKRHYSFHPYKDNRRRVGRNRHLFVGPGEKLVLLTPDCDGLFVWRNFIDDSGQDGINCAVFRNESPARSSALILAAEELALSKWPDAWRFYTYVDADRIRCTRVPGKCFLKAGWTRCGTSDSGKVILEKVINSRPYVPSSQSPDSRPLHANRQLELFSEID